MISNILSRWGLSPVVALIVAIAATDSAAQPFDEVYSDWPVQLKINGRIVIDNGFSDWGDSKQLLVSIARDNSVVFFHRGVDGSANPLAEALISTVGDEGYFQSKSFTTLPITELKETFSWASVVVIQSRQEQGSDLASLLKLKPQLDEFLARGQTLVVDTAVARLLGRIVMPTEPSTEGAVGLNLVPDSMLQCDFGEQNDSKGRMLDVVTNHPRTVGIGLPRGVILLFAGRKLTCHGSGQITFVLAGCDHSPPRIESLNPENPRRIGTPETLVDLTEWRRDAIDRTLKPFPPAEQETPFVDNGTLVIVGGGGSPPGLMNKFVEFAGGVENARLVYIPCVEEDNASWDVGPVPVWKRMGVKHVAIMHTKDRQRANTDEQFLAPLTEATGVWFGGGRQWNLADSYYGTRAHQLMKEVLHRGGVVGGSSAGASIQARYLARATPIGNTRIMASGYERGGLGFISGVAIDQHFSQRGRQKDMTQLMSRYPQLLGIGLDEATAIIVQKSKADVIGKGRVFFYDRNQPVEADQPDYIALPTDSSYDLAKRSVLVDGTPAPEKDKTEGKPE
ncbi:MAG: cyanophycinase [Planctomycetota bacterium]